MPILSTKFKKTFKFYKKILCRKNTVYIRYEPIMRGMSISNRGELSSMQGLVLASINQTLNALSRIKS
jgi:hypothetical protein